MTYADQYGYDPRFPKPDISTWLKKSEHIKGPTNLDEVETVYEEMSYTDNRWKVETFDNLHWLLPFVKGHVLECGCGWGGITKMLAPRADAVIALDISPTCIQKCEETMDMLQIHNVEWECCAFEELDFDDYNEYFDTIWATDFVEHLLDPEKATTKMYDMLKDGGSLLISVPFEEMCPSELHIQHFSVNKMREMIDALPWKVSWVTAIDCPKEYKQILVHAVK
jgi:2-polyprenyl-3-methyl-5-hydroxy-6-metoxy-1,4-benzoquinol methylase